MTADTKKSRIALIKYDKDGNLVCPGCGSISMTTSDMTENGPKFDCGGCAIKPTLNLMSDEINTKMFWSF